MDETLPTSDSASPHGGPQVDIGLFSRVQQVIQSVRLLQDERIVVEVGDVAAEVHVARKEFEMGHLEPSLRAVSRLASAFDQKVAQWESRARKKESDKSKLSMLQIRKMNAEHAGVRTRVQLVRAQLRRLRTGLDHLDKMRSGQAIASAGPEPPDPAREPGKPE